MTKCLNGIRIVYIYVFIGLKKEVMMSYEWRYWLHMALSSIIELKNGDHNLFSEECIICGIRESYYVINCNT